MSAERNWQKKIMKPSYKLYKYFIIRKFCGYVAAYDQAHAIRLAGKMHPDFKEVISVKLVDNPEIDELLKI